MKKIYSLLLAVIALFAVNTAKGQEYTVVKSWDFTNLQYKEGVTYSDELVTINKIGCNLGTGNYEGLAWQGPEKWFGLDIGGFGLYNGNGGARTMGVLNLTAGQRIEIVANTDGALNLETADIATLASTEDVTPEGNDIGRTKYTFDITADGNFGFKLQRYYNVFSITISEANGGGEDPTPSYAVGKMVFADMEGIQAGQISGETVLDGGDYTITIAGSDAQFRAWNDNMYLEITTGTITVKGVNGKKINHIVFTGNTGIFKADCGTLSGLTWTGDAETVVFTNSILQSSFTAITVGDYADPATEAANIAAAKALGAGTEVKIALNGTYVSFVDGNYAYIQDETGGLRVENTTLNLKAGTALTGSISGLYSVSQSLPTLSVSPNTPSSEFTATETEFTAPLATEYGLNAMQYTCQIVRLVGSTQISGSWLSFGSGMYWYEDKFKVIPEGYTYPDNIGSIVLLAGSDGASTELYPISTDLIIDAKDVKPEVAANIAALKAMPNGIAAELKLDGTKVTVDETTGTSGEEPSEGGEPSPLAETTERTIIIEDATGALQLIGGADFAAALPEAFTGDSIELSGSLFGTFVNSGSSIGLKANDNTAASEITAKATDLVPTVMTVNESKDKANSLKYIQYNDVTLTSDATSGKYYVNQGQDDVELVDKFNKMQYADNGGTSQIVLPEGTVSINGIIYLNASMGEYEFWPLCRTEEVKEQAYKTVTETEVFLPTEENVAAAMEEGWLTGCGTRTDNKKGNIDPATGETIETATAFPGIGVKKDNDAKTFVMYVTGADAVTGYGVTTSSSEARSLVITATPDDGSEAITAQAESAPNTTAVATVELDKTKKYMIDFTGISAEGKGGDVAVHGVLLTVKKPEPQEYRKWDFTAWSEETKENLEAEALNYVDEPAPAGTETGWRRYEKNGKAWEGENGLKDPYTIYWYGSYINEPTELKANGETIAETAGLLFNNVTNLDNTVAIAIDYPETSIGKYAGASYLWLNGTDLQFTIPTVLPGQKILMEVESHKNTGDNKRGVRLSVNGTQIGEGIPVTKTSYEWIVPESMGTDPVDVLVASTSGCHIYLIEVGDADKFSVGINEVNANANTENNVYTINGIMVRKAGESLDGLAKGLYIIGGKKVVIK